VVTAYGSCVGGVISLFIVGSGEGLELGGDPRKESKLALLLIFGWGVIVPPLLSVLSETIEARFLIVGGVDGARSRSLPGPGEAGRAAADLTSIDARRDIVRGE
jgi:hypothetical protein